MSTLVIDGTGFAFAKYDVDTSDIVKDYQAENGDTVRYITRKDVVSIKCTVFMEKSELITFKTLLATYNEHSISYWHGGVQSLIGYIDTKSYKRIFFADGATKREAWEVTFEIKECKR